MSEHLFIKDQFVRTARIPRPADHEPGLRLFTVSPCGITLQIRSQTDHQVQYSGITLSPDECKQLIDALQGYLNGND